MVTYLSKHTKRTISVWYMFLILISAWYTYSQNNELTNNLTKIQIEHIISDYQLYAKSQISKNILIPNENYINNDELVDDFAKITPLVINKKKKKINHYNTTIRFFNKNDNLSKSTKLMIGNLGKKDYIYKLNKNDTIELFGKLDKKGYVLIIKHLTYESNTKNTLDSFFITIAIASIVNLLIFLYVLSLIDENEKDKQSLYEEQVKLNSILEDKIEEKTKEYKEQQEKLKQQDLNILAQSKNAQMGEMIGNIAHQWRQPLSVISTAASGMRVEKEFNLLTDDKFYTLIDNIMANIKFLSETIETFTKYIKEKKELRTVVLQDRIRSILNIQGSTLTNNNIKLIDNIDEVDDINIKMITGELEQVLMNLINNAKDILISKNTQDNWIKLEIVKYENNVAILVSDNGGGIPNNILPKIFDPYFTTKHQSQGTGLGLHMSKKIIEESLNGKLSIKNGKYGAIFKVELPL